MEDPGWRSDWFLSCVFDIGEHVAEISDLFCNISSAPTLAQFPGGRQGEMDVLQVSMSTIEGGELSIICHNPFIVTS